LKKRIVLEELEEAEGRIRAAQHRRQLPAQIGDIADPRTHALAHKGRREMGGVAGDEQPPFPPLAGHRRTEGVDGGAFQNRILGGDPARQQWPGVTRHLTLAQRNLPAAAFTHTTHIGRRPRRVAMLDGIDSKLFQCSLKKSGIFRKTKCT
jgi:hypothetical protein